MFLAASVKETFASSSESTCRLWLAPSELSINPAADPRPLGLYAGVDYSTDDLIPVAEVAIPLVDFFDEAYKASGRYTKDILDQISGHTWTGEHAASHFEGNYTTSAFIPGIGILANYHSGVSNIDWDQPSVLFRDHDDFTEPGKPHLSRGAITPYHNLTIKATRKIPAGMELFANFGLSWEDDDKTSAYAETISRKDYEEADKIVDHIEKFMSKFDAETTPELKEEILDFMLEKVLGAAAGKQATVIRSLIPAHAGKLKKVQEAGGTFNYRNKNLIKSQKWLSQNGMCIDNLKSGTSTVPEAGRGAFARHKIKGGAIIAPVPVHPVSHNQVMTLFNIIEEPGDEDGEIKTKLDRKAGSIGQQLAVNYCLGHPESNMLLFPFGSMFSLVNHAPEGKANAELIWSEEIDRFHINENFHELSPKKIAKEEAPVMVMMLMALRDIEEGEEIFINYGEEWINAWEEYKSNWEKNVAKTEWPLKGRELVEKYKDKPFPVDKDNALPDGVNFACYVDKDYLPDGVPSTTADGSFMYVWKRPDQGYRGQSLIPCTPQSFEANDEYGYVYTIAAMDYEEDSVILGVPHEAITLVDGPYSSDMFTPGAFRHYIGIDDNKFPEAWRK